MFYILFYILSLLCQTLMYARNKFDLAELMQKEEEVFNVKRKKVVAVAALKDAKEEEITIKMRAARRRQEFARQQEVGASAARFVDLESSVSRRGSLSRLSSLGASQSQSQSQDN